MFSLFNPDEINITPFMFFTGKGGVGKTSTACALAISLSNKGKKVLIVSTDPASNLQDVFEMELTNEIKPISGVEGLFACNLDPEVAAREYREKVVGPYRGKLPDSVIQNMEEQLSGACTVEIAAFDEFTNLLANPDILKAYDHVVFDTAPTGHTLRLLQLPTAWSDFLKESTHGASCLGPLSGLNEKKEAYAKSVQALSEQDKTTLVLVTRPDDSSLNEASRASKELGEIGIKNQILLVNGVLHKVIPEDKISVAFYNKQQKALEKLPLNLKDISKYEIPLVPFSLTGISALGNLFNYKNQNNDSLKKFAVINLPPFKQLIDNLDARGIKVIFTMGKGGVGKTTIASAIAIGLAHKGKRVHLTTTDPAAHLTNIFESGSSLKDLTISKIDPKVEVEQYRSEVLSKVSKELDEAAIDYIKEDLESPCTEEIAIFQAFAKVVARSKDEIVVIDTAPTGHTLLLLDATQSYYQELQRTTGEVPDSVKELLPRLRNKHETEVVIVTLPEATPVFEANRLQEDLKRAEITPGWWVINQCFYATETDDPILRGRASSEKVWIEKVRNELAKNIAIVPWLTDEKIGVDQLNRLISGVNKH